MPKQGGVYRIALQDSKAATGKNNHWLGLVLQIDALNNSKLNTAIVVGITTNVQFAGLPGNVLLKKGEANLPEDAIVNISQLMSVNKSWFMDYIGSISQKKMTAVHNGIKLIAGID